MSREIGPKLRTLTNESGKHSIVVFKEKVNTIFEKLRINKNKKQKYLYKNIVFFIPSALFWSVKPGI